MGVGMLFANSGVAGRVEVAAATHAAEALQGVVWLDLLDPTEAERSLVERATGLRLPARADLAEIENSSRLSEAGGVLSMSMPISTQDTEAQPLGFVLSGERLVTVRYTALPTFDQYAAEMAGRGGGRAGGGAPGGGALGGVAVFIGLLEVMVDRVADILETIRAELDGISRRVFRPEGRRTPAKADQALRATLRGVGRGGDRLSNLRDTLLGLQRIVQYVPNHPALPIPADDMPRMATLGRDIASLADYDNQLSNKVQFLLDATLGFINIEQNNSIKLLTVVSIVGVPPTLVASIYGMNFKNIPELQWDYGYPYALGLIVLTAVLPLVVFRWKGWI